jgi:hypothetical protein
MNIGQALSSALAFAGSGAMLPRVKATKNMRRKTTVFCANPLIVFPP